MRFINQQANNKNELENRKAWAECLILVWKCLIILFYSSFKFVFHRG